MALPMESDKDLKSYMSRHPFKPLRPGQTSYWQNYSKFFVSFQKAMFGDAATAANNYAYDWLPKRDVPTYDIIRAFELARAGKINGYFMQGFNPLMTFPDQNKDAGRPQQAEVARGAGPAGNRNCQILGKSRPLQRRRYQVHPD